ncbi:MAG: hypothetical protein WKF77_07100 [Planctomycetaceae bacterium]
MFGLAIPVAKVYRSIMLDPLYDFNPLAATSVAYATWVGWIWDFAVPAACAAIGLSWLMGAIRPIWQQRGIRVCWILSVVNYLLALTAITVHAGLVTHLAGRLRSEKSELHARCATFGLLETQLTPEAVRDEYAWEGDPAAMILPDSSTFDEYDLQDLIGEYRRVVRSRTAPPNLCLGILATELNLLAEGRKETDKILWVDLHLDLQFYSNGNLSRKQTSLNGGPPPRIALNGNRCRSIRCRRIAMHFAKIAIRYSMYRNYGITFGIPTHSNT